MRSNEEFNSWIESGGPVALIGKEVLKSVEDPEIPIYPPTYAPPKDKKAAGAGWSPYVIDRIGDPATGVSTVIIDNFASQANRMEVIFGAEKYRHLVPQNAVEVTPTKVVPFLEAGQRATDAVVQFSAWREEIEAALRAYREGDATPLARIAPTTLVFGAFESRGAGTKIPRLVSSTIRAYDVHEQRYAGQYVPPVDYVGLGIVQPDEAEAKSALSEIGLNSIPISRGQARGGVIVKGEIVRSTTLNLVALRSLGDRDAEGTAKLRRYIMGLALVSATYPQEYALRQGCLLRLDRTSQRLALRDGAEDGMFVRHDEALAFATAAALAFGVAEGRTLPFRKELIEAELAKTKKERKSERRQKRSDVEEEQEE